MKLKQKITKFNLFAIIFPLFFLLFQASSASAALFLFDSSKQEFGISEEFQVNLNIDTEGQKINAIEGKISFPEDIVELKEIKDGNSIINFWIEKPQNQEKGEVKFSGIIPGGYQGEKGFLFNLLFQAKTNGMGAVNISEARALLNDGSGTEAKVKISAFQFSISKDITVIKAEIPAVEDFELPEIFQPEIGQNADIFEGKYFLVFSTQDKKSGIDHYEIREGRRSFIIAESPYILVNQKLDQKISVKAVDKSGNERIVVLPPLKPLPWYLDYKYIGILIIVGFIIIGIVWRKKI